MKGKYHFRAILLMSFTILLSIQGTAQQSAFFTPTTSQNISSARQQYIGRLTGDPATKSMRYVRFADLPQQITSDGGLFLNLSGTSRNLEFRPTHYELKDNGDYTWYGKNRRTNTQVALIKMRDRLGGFIQSDTGFWEIVPLKKDVSIIREMDISMFQNEKCGLDAMLEEYPSLNQRITAVDICDENENCGAVIDVLVLIPPDVTAWYGTEFDDPWGPFIHMLATLSSFQLALINSGIENVELRFETESFDFSYTDPLILRDDVDNLSIQAAYIRNQHKADLVIMLTSMDYPNFRGRALVGQEINDVFNYFAPSPGYAYAIVEIENALNPTQTFAHEMAHLFGARHNQSDNVLACDDCGDDEDICAHGFRFDEGGLDRTVMALLLDTTVATGSQRVLHFSNPDVQFNGFVTGTADDNNALGVRNGACIVSNHREAGLGVTMSGPNVWCRFLNDDFPHTYTANISEPLSSEPGLPPYTYEWRYSPSGNFTPANPGSLLGTGSSVTISSVLSCPEFFLRLNVTSSDGITVNTTRVINTWGCEDCDSGFGFFRTNTESSPNRYNDNQMLSIQPDADDSYLISPNPFSSNLQIEKRTNKDSYFEVSVFDVTGKVVHQVVNDNQSVLNIDLSKYPDGIFTVRITDDNEIMTQKVIKVQK